MANLLSAYFADEARAFFALNVRERRDRERALVRSTRPIAPAVLETLRAQNSAFGASATRNVQLAKLSAGARVVVTGQQVGLFLGPLYTLYKAASAIQLAQLMERETGIPVVPVFWLQTEDHDLPEIARSHVPRAGAAPFVIGPAIAHDNRRSIAHVQLPDEIAHCNELLQRELQQHLHAPEHLARVARHYHPGQSWGNAFAGLLAELFEPEGLLLLDPRDPVLARESAWVHRFAFEHASELEHALHGQSRALSHAGFASTVRLRPGSPLSFYHPEGPLGPRTRLQHEGDHYTVPRSHQRHSLSELMSALERDPLYFSSSALLRPIVQDALLPTAAYVGGPAELAYYAQLPALYKAFKLEPSMVAPRARFRLIEPKAARLLERLELSASDLAHDEAKLLTLLAAQDPERISADHFEHGLQRRLADALATALQDLPEDLTHELERHIDKTRSKVSTSAKKLSERYATALARRDPQRVSDLHQLKQLLFPDGAPQERSYGFSYYAARFGERPLIERILAALDPLAMEITELTL